MATIKDVAKLAGVSLGTVSNVLNGKTNNELLIRRVEQAMEQLSYLPNSTARSLKSTRTGLIGVIVPDGDGTLFTLSATEIMTGDQVTAQVYARGAERIRLSKVNGNGDTVHTFEQEGYSGIDYDMGEWWPGVFTVTAEAFYADQDAWQQVGDPIELTVTTHGDMDFFASELPALVWAGDESIVFRFDDCGNIVGGEYEDAPDGWYKVCINDTMQDGYVVNYDYDWNDAGEHAVTPDMYLDGRTLEAGHVYWFGMGAWRPHYTPGGSIEIHTAVVDPDKVLRLPAGLTEIDEEAFAGTSAQAVFIPAKACYELKNEMLQEIAAIAGRFGAVPVLISGNSDTRPARIKRRARDMDGVYVISREDMRGGGSDAKGLTERLRRAGEKDEKLLARRILALLDQELI